MESDQINLGLAGLRIGLGLVFLAHGIKHARGREKTTAWFRSLGFLAPGQQWLVMAITEMGSGALLVLGLATGLAAAAVVATMFVAYWVNHRPAGFWITAFMREGIDVEGWEYVFVLALLATGIAITGPGEWAIDSVIEREGVAVAQLLDGWVGLVLVMGSLGLAALQISLFWRPARWDSSSTR